MQITRAFRVLVTGVLGIFFALSRSNFAAAQPSMTLREGAVNATATLEIDASEGAFGDVVSIAPDVSVGATQDLTVSVIHSTVGRTGFRGSAGSGICVTDACSHTYDNAGLEALYSLARGSLALAANAGVHATSFDAGFYVAKLGAKARYTANRLSITTLASITIAATHRDDTPPNRDRLWLPIVFMYRVSGGLSLGVGTGLKAPFDDMSGSYEIALGGVAQYAVSPSLSFGASWVHGKLVGGDNVIPDDASGLDYRAIQLWVSMTR